MVLFGRKRTNIDIAKYNEAVKKAAELQKVLAVAVKMKDAALIEVIMDKSVACMHCLHEFCARCGFVDDPNSSTFIQCPKCHKTVFAKIL